MKIINYFIPFLSFWLMSIEVSAQTNNDIQGTWRLISNTITFSDGKLLKWDSSTYNLTKTITNNRVMATLFSVKDGALWGAEQGKAMTKGNQYIEIMEQSTDTSFINQPLIFTYRIEGDKLYYEGGKNNIHIVEVLKRLE